MIADAALYGWTRNYNKVVYDREAAFCSKAKAVVNEIKKKSMLKSNDINKIFFQIQNLMLFLIYVKHRIEIIKMKKWYCLSVFSKFSPC